MLKVSVICLLWATIQSENIEWFDGEWSPVVMYSNVLSDTPRDWVKWTERDGYKYVWSGGLMDSAYHRKKCGSLNVTRSTNRTCSCGSNRNIPLVQIKDEAQLDTLQFYKFRYNEPRPVIEVDTVDEVEAALAVKCMCGDEEYTQLVFRKTKDDYLISYENRAKTRTGPNMTLIMMRHVPTMSQVYNITNRASDELYRESNFWTTDKLATLMCDPKSFDATASWLGVDIDAPLPSIVDKKRTVPSQPQVYVESEKHYLLSKVNQIAKSDNKEVQSLTSIAIQLQDITYIHYLAGVVLLCLS